MIETAKTESATWKTHRFLGEPTLESIEEEIGVGAAPAAPQRAGGDGLDTSSQRWTELGQKLGHNMLEQVRRKPGQAALVALGVGALSAWLLRTAVQRRGKGH